ncbi:Myb-like DNA-binding domain protein [Rhodotorula mucilaginosa]|uniref:Myb-like DNA-binding domain protein n=1 Tax=Rhodotorula mucilaginosa TaxID=5537 RepID=A0A9P7B586_RHOMI|nr:Myb-like DNA-binding domain protein [Rhodotorula mucilaginosa]TKA56958.1 hypothetical protein B0A53_01359 [Rhodotorula sp. CCFEE 5036]
MVLPTPPSPAGEIEALRAMDDDADRAIVANEAYKEELVKAMERVDMARQRMRQLEVLIRSLSDSLDSSASNAGNSRNGDLPAQDYKVVAPGTLQATTPYFRFFYGKNLPPNEDAEARERYLSTVRLRAWLPPEREKLEQEVRAQNYRLVAQHAMQTGQDLTDAVAEVDPNWFVQNTTGLDWDQIALVLERRTAAECRIQWLQQQHPLIRADTTNSGKSNFTKDEMNKLRQLVEQRGPFGGKEGWQGIARDLGTNRTAAACFRAYNLRPHQPREPWTAEDDALLLSSVYRWGQNWSLVSRMVGHSIPSTVVRFNLALAPGYTRGRWTEEEDMALRRAVVRCGVGNWAEVSERVKGKSDSQCRERWTNSVDPRIVGYANWTREEDETLLRLRDGEGLGWIEISEQGFQGRRTDNSCLRRYHDLVKKKKSKPAIKRQRAPRADDGDGDGDVDGGSGDPAATPPPPPPKKKKKKEKEKEKGGSAVGGKSKASAHGDGDGGNG